MLSVGTKVRLKHTGARGTITALLDDGMLLVLLYLDDMEIPVFEEDVVAEGAYTEVPKNHPIQEGQQKNKDKAINVAENKGKNTGVQLAFDPEYDQEGIVTRYTLFLLNDTQHALLFSLRVKQESAVPKEFHGKIDLASIYLLDEIRYDQLNENLAIEIDSWRITTAGTESKQTRTIKIKPKSFFKKIVKAPLLNRPVHLYSLFNSEVKIEKKAEKEDLKTYTQKNVRPMPSLNYQSFEIHNVKEFANFNIELDLHIEKIAPDTFKLNSAEKMRLQLKHFDRYIEKAIRLGVSRVFIIHGVGKGKLRNAIASRLIKMPEVETFKNEYHPKYGWGATEVIL